METSKNIWALKYPLAICVLLSGQSNLTFKIICNKHLLNMYMNDAQANKRNEAEIQRTIIS